MIYILVKKVNPDWFPSESPRLLVGEKIEITDPKNLILNGDVEAIGENGEVISAFELYGQASKSEMEEFQSYMNLKRAEATKAALEETQAELKEQLAKVEEKSKEEVKVEEPAPLYVAKKDK